MLSRRAVLAMLPVTGLSITPDYNGLLFSWTNRYREAYQLRALSYDTDATRHCNWKTRALYYANLENLAHDLPGDPVGAQVPRNGVDLARYGAMENLACQLPGADLTDMEALLRCFTALVMSKGHQYAMTRPELTRLGVDVWRGPSKAMYVAQLFLYPTRVIDGTATGEVLVR